MGRYEEKKVISRINHILERIVIAITVLLLGHITISKKNTKIKIRLLYPKDEQPFDVEFKLIVNNSYRKVVDFVYMTNEWQTDAASTVIRQTPWKRGYGEEAYTKVLREDFDD